MWPHWPCCSDYVTQIKEDLHLWSLLGSNSSTVYTYMLILNRTIWDCIPLTETSSDSLLIHTCTHTDIKEYTSSWVSHMNYYEKNWQIGPTTFFSSIKKMNPLILIWVFALILFLQYLYICYHFWVIPPPRVAEAADMGIFQNLGLC